MGAGPGVGAAGCGWTPGTCLVQGHPGHGHAAGLGTPRGAPEAWGHPGCCHGCAQIPSVAPMGAACRLHDPPCAKTPPGTSLGTVTGSVTSGQAPGCGEEAVGARGPLRGPSPRQGHIRTPPSSGIISGDTRGESSAVPRGRCTATSSPASPGKGRNGCWGLAARKVGSTPGCWLGLGRAQRSPVHAPSLSILGSEEGSPGQMAAPKGIPVSIPAAHRQTLGLWYPTGGSPGW